MRIVRYAEDGVARVGIRLDGTIVPAGCDTVSALIRDGADALNAAAKSARQAQAEGRIAAPERLLAPLERPGRMFFCGVNYADHVAEVPNRAYPKEPSIFAKAVIEIWGRAIRSFLPERGSGQTTKPSWE